MGAKHGNLKVVKLMSTFGVYYSSYDSLKKAVENDKYDIVDFLLEEFRYTPHQLDKIFYPELV